MLFSYPVVSDSVTPWTAECQASLSLTVSWSLPKFMFISSMILSGHLMPPFHSAFFPSIRDFSNESSVCIRWWIICLHQMTKILELQLHHQSFQWVFKVDLPLDWLVWSPWCPRDFQESSPAPQFKGINSLVFCLLYSKFPRKAVPKNMLSDNCTHLPC